MKIITDKENILYSKAAEIISDLLKQKPNANIAFITGNSVKKLYIELNKKNINKEMSFSEMKAFVVSEFKDLSIDNSHNSLNFLNEYLFKNTDFKSVNIFTPAKFNDDELEKYDELINNYGGLDLIVLGIGINGSIGFNEPATPYNSKTHKQLLTDKTKEYLSDRFGDIDDVPEEGLTIGINTMMNSKTVLMLALGSEKANIVHKMVYGRTESFIPATMLQIHNNLVLLLDEDAASELN